jgi:two-component system chemotaxis sensor kinase CheA
MQDFETELKISFLEEAEQLLSEVEKCYLDLESNPNNATILDQIFRVAHNLKGSSKAVGFNEVGQFAHQFENLLLKLKVGEIEITPPILSLLLGSNDHLSQMIQQLKISLDATFDSSDLILQIESALRGELSDTTIETVPNANDFPPEEPPQEVPFSAHEVEAELATLETNHEHNNNPEFQEPTTKPLTLVTEEHHAQEPRRPVPPPPNSNNTKQSNTHQGAGDESIRVSLARLEKLLNYVGEMVILQTVLTEQSQSSGDFLRKTIHQLGKVTKEVQDISMSLRMVPLKSTFQKMQRIVRDTSMELNKKVTLNLQGEETELDKTILERVNDPLVHLIRNACDHGIESTELRRERNKAEQGTIRLSAFHQNGKLVIEVADDGGGINPEVLRKKALEKRIIGPNAHISDQEAINLIFHPGFSTKAVVTDVSGRGVGMDVVKHNIESLQGDVLVETQLHKGTTFKIILPLTLAIIDAMVVKVSDSRYVIPLSHVHESVKLDPQDIKHTTGLGEILLLRGETIPLFRLNQLVGRKPQAASDTPMIALVIHGTSEHFAVLVDDIIGQYQVVIKQLGNELQNIKGFTGSSILGDGKPALILELTDLVARVKRQSSHNHRGIAA